jgi:uncharacterized protein (TIGR02145 family)
MKNYKTLALVCAAATAVFSMTSCDKGEGEPNPEIPVITITAQPADVSVEEGSITGNLTIEASVTEGATLSYRWYKSVSGNAMGRASGDDFSDTPIDGATTASLTIPTDLTEGEYFYFVELSAEGAVSVRSDIATVTVTVAPDPVATERYKTIPWQPTAQTRAGDDEKYVLAYGGTDGQYNYYVYYCGYIDFVPLLYQQAVYYNGITPITVGYSKSTSVEHAVTQGIEKAVAESVSTTNTSELTIGVSATIGFAGSGGTVSTEITESVSETVGTEVSTSNSVETSEAKVEGETFSTEATIGTAGEPVGMYRYALFSTTDVFFNVKFNRETETIEAVTVSLCARPITYWGIDYDPQLGGPATFGKTGDGDKLQIPEFDPDKMSDLVIEPSPGTEVRVGDIIWAGANVGETPGTFAADPYFEPATATMEGVRAAYGGYYQFNRRKGWPIFGAVTGWDPNNFADVSAGWTWKNDPCPIGWRVPSKDEWVALYNAIEDLSGITHYPSSFDDDYNDVYGTRYTYSSVAVLTLKEGAGKVYLPSAGQRNKNGGLGFQGPDGYYWSSTVHSSLYAYDALVDEYSMSPEHAYDYAAGFSVRCVRDAE